MFETSKSEAKDILKDYLGDTIAEVYDSNEVADAILTLCPDFEYPDWSYRTVAEFLRFFDKK